MKSVEGLDDNNDIEGIEGRDGIEGIGSFEGTDGIDARPSRDHRVITALSAITIENPLLTDRLII